MISPGINTAYLDEWSEDHWWRNETRRVWRTQLATAVILGGLSLFLSILAARESWRADDAVAQLHAIEDARRVVPRSHGNLPMGWSSSPVPLVLPTCDQSSSGMVTFHGDQTLLCDGVDWHPAFASLTTTTEWRP